jgi:hypothetical protein
MLVLPVSSAVCERGFSSQKRIKSDVRASLHSDTVEDLIRISVEGPILEDFDPTKSVAIWLTQGKRARRPHYKCWPSDHGSADAQFFFVRFIYLSFSSTFFFVLLSCCCC